MKFYFINDNKYIKDNNVIKVASNNSDIFDDILFYKTRNQLVQDFSAFNLIPCQATTTTISGFNNGFDKIIKRLKG